MKSDKNIPTSFSRWDATAKIGLASLAVFLLACIIVPAVLLSSGDRGGTESAVIPGNAVDVELSRDKLELITDSISPILRGNLSSFDGADTLNSREAVCALLAHICLTEPIPIAANGAFLVPASRLDELYSSLFGIDAPRDDIQGCVTYSADEDVFEYFGSEYHSEYTVNILSTRTLGNVVYIHAQSLAPVDIPSSSSVPSESGVSSGQASSDQTANGAAASGTASDSQDPSASGTETNVSSDTGSGSGASSGSGSDSSGSGSVVSSPETEYRVVRNVVFTVTLSGNDYIITQLRDV